MPDELTSSFLFEAERPQARKSEADRVDHHSVLRGIVEGQRVMPSSEEAEKGVLSCLFRDPQRCCGEAIENISEEHFYQPAHRTVYQILTEHYNDSKPVDLLSVTQTLMDRQKLAEAGGADRVTELATFEPDTAHFSHYLGILKEKRTLRDIIRTCTLSISKAYERQEDIEELLDTVEQEVLRVREEGERNVMRSMKDEVMDAIKKIEEISSDPHSLTGLGSGFQGLDRMTNGLHGGEMFIIAARPSMGKTSLAMNIVEHVGVTQNQPVAVFSLEMSTESLVMRLLCARAAVDMASIRGGMLGTPDFKKLMAASGDLARSPIFIDDSPGLSIMELRAKARRLHNRHGIQLIAIDYLQLLKSNSSKARDNRQIEIAEISAGIKALSKELNIPIIVLAQLNRNPEQRTGGKPRLSDLRESGSIEQDADVVGLLIRNKYYAEDDEAKEAEAGKAELIIAKQRNGPTGEVKLTFLEKFMRFGDRAAEDDEEG
ncbi:MAG: replicative DNA helicase [Verrucomicrobiota bacterium]